MLTPACEKERSLLPKQEQLAQDDELIIMNEAIELMAASMAIAMKYDAFRELIRYETNKQFDYDYDVLYRFIANKQLSIEGLGDITVSELIIEQIMSELSKSHYLNERYFKDIASKIPNLNICVPFYYENWCPVEYVPKVAAFPADFDEKTHKRVKGFDSQGNIYWLTDDFADWKLPVVTVGLSERVDENGYLKVNAGSIIIDKDYRYMTADKAYELATEYLKSGEKAHFEPLVVLMDEDFFDKITEDDEAYGSLPLPLIDEITIDSNQNNTHEKNCANPSPTKITKIHSSTDKGFSVTFEWESVIADYYEIWRRIGSSDYSLIATLPGSKPCKYTDIPPKTNALLLCDTCQKR